MSSSSATSSTTGTPKSSSTASSTSTTPPLHSHTSNHQQRKPLIGYTRIEPTEENIHKFTSIVTSAFHSTPLTTVFISEIDGKFLSSSTDQNPAFARPPFSHLRRIQHFQPGIRSAANSDAILVEAGNWSAIALWEPPEFKGKSFVEAREVRGQLFSQWRSEVRRVKAKYLAAAADPSLSSGSPTVNGITSADGEHTENTASLSRSSSQHNTSAADNDDMPLRPFWHLSFLARNPGTTNEVGEPVQFPTHPVVPGAISAVVLPFLEQAKRQGVPAWLEATYPHAVEVYKHFGFRVCEEVVVGKGYCDERGYPVDHSKSDGDEVKAPGLRAWGMIFDSHLR